MDRRQRTEDEPSDPRSENWPVGSEPPVPRQHVKVPASVPPASSEQRPPGNRRGVVLLVVVAVLLAAALGSLGYAFWPSPHQSGVTSTSVSGSPQGSSAPGAPSNAASLASATAPAMVNVNTTQPSLGVAGAGSGMVLRRGGDVLTNNHVIEGSSTITVADVGNGRTYKASVLGYDRAEDVAVVHLSDASGLQTIRVGDSSQVRTGQGVVAVGNSGGKGGAPSYAGGVVTATDQAITAQDQSNGTSESLDGLIATSAALVPGYSGGALVNTSERVIGMVTAGSEGFQLHGGGTEGYAVPMNKALAVADQILAGRASAAIHIGPTAYLGVLVQTTARAPGAIIAQVIPSSPAANAGLVSGETIIAVDGHTVTTPEDLTNALLSTKPGALVQITSLDPNGTARTTSVRLGSGPPQ